MKKIAFASKLTRLMSTVWIKADASNAAEISTHFRAYSLAYIVV